MTEISDLDVLERARTIDNGCVEIQNALNYLQRRMIDKGHVNSTVEFRLTSDGNMRIEIKTNDEAAIPWRGSTLYNWEWTIQSTNFGVVLDEAHEIVNKAKPSTSISCAPWFDINQS